MKGLYKRRRRRRQALGLSISRGDIHTEVPLAQELHQNVAVLVLRYLFQRRLANSDFFRNFERPFTPRTWLRSARNFGKTRFRQFATFHFSTLKLSWKMFSAKILGLDFFFKKVRFWRSYEFLIPVGRCVVKSYCRDCPYFWGNFLGERVNDSICVEILDLPPKKLLPFGVVMI